MPPNGILRLFEEFLPQERGGLGNFCVLGALCSEAFLVLLQGGGISFRWLVGWKERRCFNGCKLIVEFIELALGGIKTSLGLF